MGPGSQKSKKSIFPGSYKAPTFKTMNSNHYDQLMDLLAYELSQKPLNKAKLRSLVQASHCPYLQKTMHGKIGPMHGEHVKSMK